MSNFEKPPITFKNSTVERHAGKGFAVEVDANPVGRAVIGVIPYRPHAQLFAASSDMYEALKKTQDCFNNLLAKGNVNWGNTFGVDFGLMNEALLAQDKAIAKAEGRL